jgi:hypothetical protein
MAGARREAQLFFLASCLRDRYILSHPERCLCSIRWSSPPATDLRIVFHNERLKQSRRFVLFLNADLPIDHLLQIRHAYFPFFAYFECGQFASFTPIPNRLLRHAKKSGEFPRVVDCFLFTRHDTCLNEAYRNYITRSRGIGDAPSTGQLSHIFQEK